MLAPGATATTLVKSRPFGILSMNSLWMFADEECEVNEFCLLYR